MRRYFLLLLVAAGVAAALLWPRERVGDGGDGSVAEIAAPPEPLREWRLDEAPLWLDAPPSGDETGVAVRDASEERLLASLADPVASRETLEKGFALALRQDNRAAMANIMWRLERLDAANEPFAETPPPVFPSRPAESDKPESPADAVAVAPPSTEPAEAVAAESDEPVPPVDVATVAPPDGEPLPDKPIEGEEPLAELERRIVMLVDDGCPADAAELFSRALRSDARIEERLSADCLAALGVAFGELRLSSRAHRLFRLALEKEPANRRGLLASARLFRREGRADGAVARLRAYVAAFPDDARGWLELADTRNALGRNAAPEYRRVVDLTAPDASGFVPRELCAARAEALSRLGRTKEARLLFATLAE